MSHVTVTLQHNESSNITGWMSGSHPAGTFGTCRPQQFSNRSLEA